jgi:hypothetical protein
MRQHLDVSLRIGKQITVPAKECICEEAARTWWSIRTLKLVIHGPRLEMTGRSLELDYITATIDILDHTVLTRANITLSPR